MLDQLRNDAFEDVGVTLNQIQPGLAFALSSARCHDAEARIRGRGVIRAGINLRVLQKRAAVLQIHHLPLQLVRHHVD